MTPRTDSSDTAFQGWTAIAISADSDILARWAATIAGDVSWFDSAIGHAERGQRSMLVLESAPTLRAHAGRFAVLDVDGVVTSVISPELLWSALDARLHADRHEHSVHGFPVGVTGYVSFEAGQLCDPALPHVPHAVPPINWSYGLAAVIIEDGVAQLCTRRGRGESAEARSVRWLARLNEVAAAESRAVGSEGGGALTVIEDKSFDRFANQIGAIMTAIRDGRYYQACLTYPLIFRRPNPIILGLYREVRSRSPGDYGGYFRWGSIELACSSPEEFLSFQEGTVRARPMKGTRRRQMGREAEQSDELRTSAKDRAENVMIVDLLRNDLGRSAVEGSVKVERLCEIETYETVLQMTSTVVATLRPEVGVFEAFGRAFPPGSMTGAPKIEACRHLAELEAQARGLYAGSVGWLGYDERAVFNVVIRSFQAWDDQMRWNTGGGIVADSEIRSEWEETRAKAAPALSLTGKPSVD